MVTAAKACLLSDLESPGEQELAEARAIQIMLPHGPLRTTDVTVCYQLQPFHVSAGYRELELRGVPPGTFSNSNAEIP
jgi:hypothetical protein